MKDTPKLDFSKSAVSRYLQLSTLFRSRIERDDWPVGQQIPTVEQLVEEFGVARATIRHALGLLENDGLIERRRAKGTFVKKKPSDKLWFDVVTDIQGLLMPRKPAQIELISKIESLSPKDMPSEIGALEGSYKHFFRRHWRNREPFAIIEVYLTDFIYSQLGPTDLIEKNTLQLLTDLPGTTVRKIKQTLTIETADITIAESLKISLNSPVAVVIRYMFDQNDKFLAMSKGRYPGEMVRLDMLMK